ncbi:uncharacterized protein MYCGRDRAFT_39862 [Zymoseptoria tritici IPO323]|uniref:Nicotinamide N-methyltransferase n=1 Tax=Zymoseptoria tritici (strain CBS 115943 / IPO323) TaxID=336722 RepID=F9X8X9_ZYMTI|nr:uncharacterized protein MYCGRDRAFT_39862 [Zymoseptoria tritici IPO323]EGP87915.1 hypothetical protein MYCGRDRAFT_39862 [Zymoseptoria tritici IPO323]
MSLTDLISVVPLDGEEEEAEDIFAFAAGLIFPGDTRIVHGDERSVIVYRSQRFGDIELRNADPQSEDERRLYAHYLWNAGLKMAELISSEVDARWSVKGHRVLELGAGVGLTGIVACLAGAQEVVISDYPATALIENIERNTKKAIPPEFSSKYSVQGYEWGDCASSFATSNRHSFSRIVAADCYWMPNEHKNLVTSMLHLLDDSFEARVLAIAGFHTGRANLAGFFDEAEEQGLEVEEIVEEDVAGVRRDWARERDGGIENQVERKRWLVIAVLKRRSS